MQRLEVNGVIQPLYVSLGVKGLLLQWFWQIAICLLTFEFDIQRAMHRDVLF